MYQKNKLLNIKELAKETGIKESWYRRQVFLKRIPHYKVQGLLRFNLQEIHNWIEGSHFPSYDVNGDLEVFNE